MALIKRAKPSPETYKFCHKRGFFCDPPVFAIVRGSGSIEPHLPRLAQFAPPSGACGSRAPPDMVHSHPLCLRAGFAKFLFCFCIPVLNMRATKDHLSGAEGARHRYSCGVHVQSCTKLYACAKAFPHFAWLSRRLRGLLSRSGCCTISPGSHAGISRRGPAA